LVHATGVSVKNNLLLAAETTRRKRIALVERLARERMVRL
jgi:hypothetical protein